MSSDVHYVTQQSIWANQVKGVLTDRRIQHYILQGRYGEDARLAALKKPHKPYRAKLEVAKTKRQKLNELLKKVLA